MIDKNVTKECSHCRQIKPLFDFYKCKRWIDGHRYECKSYSIKITQKYQSSQKGKNAIKQYRLSGKEKLATARYSKTKKGKENNRNYRMRSQEKIKAQNIVNTSVKYGRLISPKALKCHVCGEKADHYHHNLGYEPIHWLNVIPLCRFCHRYIHTKTPSEQKILCTGQQHLQLSV